MTRKNETIAKNLSKWFMKNARELPWRSNPHPYWVWLSEIMLQQTQVTTVLPYFEKFTKKFPTVQDLAKAHLDEVYALWAGLGYYSRARNLHRGAMAIAERIVGGRGFPSNRDEWLAIPGVGEYTAGAICSIALGLREPIVDGNVVRVISRLEGIVKLDSKRAEIWANARELVAVRAVKPSVINQALMELGAMVCKPKNPKCDVCPVSEVCIGKRAPEKYPEPKKKVIWKRVQEHKWILVGEAPTSREKKGLAIYLEQNQAGGWREGLWDFPNAGKLSTLKEAVVREEFTVKYTVTTHKIERKHTVLQVKEANRKKLSLSGKWFSLVDVPGVPSPVKKALGKL